MWDQPLTVPVGGSVHMRTSTKTFYVFALKCKMKKTITTHTIPSKMYTHTHTHTHTHAHAHTTNHTHTHTYARTRNICHCGGAPNIGKKGECLQCRGDHSKWRTITVRDGPGGHPKDIGASIQSK
jgi:hypothetical protein